MFCTKCGAQILENARFCRNCGASVDINKSAYKKNDSSEMEHSFPDVLPEAEDIQYPDNINEEGLIAEGNAGSPGEKHSFFKGKGKIIIAVAAALVILVSGGFIFNNYTRAENVKEHMKLANKYLQEGKYDEAVLEFNKVLEIEPKSTEARVGLGTVYTKQGKYDEADKVLREAQAIDPRNEKLLLEIIDILKEGNPESAYELLQIYLEAAGQGGISDKIRELLASAEEDPVIPELDPPPGAYAQPVEVKLIQDRIRLGHTFYYTTDNSEPDNNCIQYRQPIQVNEGETTIKIIGYNPRGKTTEVKILGYTVNTEPKEMAEAALNEAQQLYDTTTEGSEIGNCTSGSKDKLMGAVNQCRDILKGTELTVDQAQQAYCIISSGLDDFKRSIISPSDKTALNDIVEKAKGLASSSAEGTQEGQVQPGSIGRLNDAIAAAEAVLNNISAQQPEVDAAVSALQSALESFEDSRVKNVVNPDGTNFTYGFKTLMGNEETKTFSGRFEVVASGTANLVDYKTKDVYAGETGSIEIVLTREDNMVTTTATETWDKDGSWLKTVGIWYAEYDGADNTFKLYPAGEGVNSIDRFEGKYIDGRMIGKMYIDGIGYFMDFTAQ